MTIRQTLAMLELFREHVHAVITKRAKAPGLRSALYLGALVYARASAPKLVDELHSGVGTGAGLAPDSPALTLRNWLLDGKAVAHEKPAMRIQMILHAIHLHIEGKPLSKMVWNREGEARFKKDNSARIGKAQAILA